METGSVSPNLWFTHAIARCPRRRLRPADKGPSTLLYPTIGLVMNQTDQERLRIVRDYHERTKHRPERYAASLGYMDWANAPHPFRSFAGTEQIALAHPEGRAQPTYDSLFAEGPGPAPLDAHLIARLFYQGMALSAWKKAAGMSAWALRINPSSGNLHPTEAYLIAGVIPGLIDRPGVFHYGPHGHSLERRGELSMEQWNTLTEGMPDHCLLIGLTSIHWRESWKYGERAFRYCNHDVGHALGALAFSARILGWEARLIANLAEADLDRLLGTHLQQGIEAEHADCLVAFYPSGPIGRKERIPVLSPDDWRQRVPAVSFVGEPNRLSRQHHEWPVIDEVARAARFSPAEQGTRLAPSESELAGPIHKHLLPDRGHPADKIVRQRRSAVAMDPMASLDAIVFFQMLARTLPSGLPFDVLPWTPRVALAIFVHRVKDLDPGLYLLVRNPVHEATLCQSLEGDVEWTRPAGCPEHLPLFRLLSGDARQAAAQISCHQDIAGDGVFSLGMLTEFDQVLATEGPHFYPRLFWETGLIGQVLYLEAEAAGIRGTGIGCFFDDLMHRLLGIGDRSWQSLYHFTVGGPVEDKRLQTVAPYHHIEAGD